MAVTPGGHLLHVGYPKTGSKFLQRWFAAHQDIAFSYWGIAGFRDSHALVGAAAGTGPAWHATSHEALLTPMADLDDFGAGAGTIALPTRAAQESACRLLAALFPAGRVLIVVRGHEALIRSFYGELVVGGAGYGFAEFCDALLVQVEAGSDAFHFDAAIQAYSEAFGEERLLVLPYELLRDRSDDFLGAIEAELGVRPLRLPSERVRPSPSDARVAAYRRMTRWMDAVPGTARLRRRYVAALRAGRLGHVAAAVERLPGGSDGDGHAVPRRLLEALAGRSERLRGNPLFRAYARDYFL